jgi:hypothetical protein
LGYTVAFVFGGARIVRHIWLIVVDARNSGVDIERKLVSGASAQMLVFRIRNDVRRDKLRYRCYGPRERMIVKQKWQS